MKKQAIIEIQEPGGATTYIVGTAVNVTVTGGQKIDPFVAPGAAQDGEVYISVGGRRRPLGDVKVYRVGYTSSGVSAPAPAGVVASTNPQASTLTVTGTPAIGAAPTSWILGLTGAGAPKAVYVEGARSHAFTVAPGVNFVPYAIALYGTSASVKITGAAASVAHPNGTAPVFNSPPTILGDAQAYELLSVDAGDVSNGTVDVAETKWYLDGELIPGRQGAAVRLAPGDVNHRLRAAVVARNADGFTAEAVTAETALVTGRPIVMLSLPAITGGGRVGDTQDLDDGTANYWSSLYRAFKIDGTEVANGSRGYNESTMTWVPEAGDAGKVATLENTFVGTESRTYVSDPLTILPSSAPAPGPAPSPAPSPAATALPLSLAANPSFNVAESAGIAARNWDPATETYTYSTSAGTTPIDFLELGTFPGGTFKPNTTYTFSVTSSSGGQASMFLYGPERTSGTLVSGRNGTFTTGSTAWHNYAQIKFEPAAGVTNGKFRVAFYEGTYTGATPVIAGAPAPAYTAIALEPSTPINGASVGMDVATWNESTQTLTYTTNATPDPVFWVELINFPVGTFKANTTYSAVVTASTPGATARVLTYDPDFIAYSSPAASNTLVATWTTGATIRSDYAQIRFLPTPSTTGGTIKVELFEGVYTGATPAPAPAPTPSPAPSPSPSPSPAPAPGGSAVALNLALGAPKPGTSVGFASASWDEATQTFSYTSTAADAEYWLALDSFPSGTFKPNTTYSITQTSTLGTAGVRMFLYTGTWSDRASSVTTTGQIVTWSTAATVIGYYGQLKFTIPTAGTGTVRVSVYEGVYTGAAPAPAPAPTPSPAPAPSPTPAPAPAPAPTGLPTRANVPMQPVMTTGATPYQDVVVGSYAVLNDTWGVSNALGSWSQQVGISSLQADGSISARFIWNFPSCKTDYDNVLSYPAIRWGTMVNKSPTPGSTLPKTIATINSLVNRVTWNTTGASGLWHVTADFWISVAGGYGSPANRRCEIMLTTQSGQGYCLPYQGDAAAAGRTAGNYSTAQHGARNPNIYVERVTLGGRQYDIFHGIPCQVVNGAYTRPSWYVGGPAPNKNWTLPWHFIAIVPVSLPPADSAFTIDWKPFLTYFVSKGWCTSSDFLWGVQWGAEPVAINNSRTGAKWVTKGDCLLNLKVTAT